MKIKLNYDENFYPISLKLREFFKKVEETDNVSVTFLIENNVGCNYKYTYKIFKDEKLRGENYFITERLIKTALWMVGGYKIHMSAPNYLYRLIKKDYSENGKRRFDRDFMSDVYEKEFEVVKIVKQDIKKLKSSSVYVSDNLKGCKIGFDGGGSDKKVSAVIDGKVVYSEERVWNPKNSIDWRYQYKEIKDSISRASEKLPRIDGIGVSTAGVCINNRVMVSSLFNKIPKEDFENHVKNIYLDIAKEFNVPIKVVNDGDVTALAGARALNKKSLLGIAMGTSQAGGYVDERGNLNGWINELAFIPIDVSDSATKDEWSGDIGVGGKYLSQDGVIKLAKLAGMDFDNRLTPAQKLEKVQDTLLSGSVVAERIYQDIGVYLGHSIAYYKGFYDIENVLLLGRVSSGRGGSIILDFAKKVIREEYPEYKNVNLFMPDEGFKRLGQSIASASLV